MNTNDKALLPCPFCGSNNIRVLPCSDEGFYIACGSEVDCNIYVESDTEEQAIAAWNRRADVAIVRDASKYESIENDLRNFAQAYPEDIFPPVSPEMHKFAVDNCPNLIGRCSAAMGRHFAPFAIKAADAIHELSQPIAATPEDADHIVDANKMVLGKENAESLTCGDSNVKESGNIEHVPEDALYQILNDPENQPSQYGTVPLSKYEKLVEKYDALADKYCAALSSRAEPTVRNIYEAMRNNAAPAYTKQDKEG